MIKKMILAAAVVGGIAGMGAESTAAVAAPPAPPPSCHGAPGGMPFLGQVSLTKAQRKKIDAILKADHPDFHADMEKESGLHHQIQDLLATPGKVDQAQIVSLQQQIASIHQAHEAERLQTAIRIHDVLTADQLTQIKAAQDKADSLHAQLRALMAPPSPPTP
ncbi:Spy/CpxP family protein refolding chaperone [Novacetimonas pomaceti]|uniref:Periplasmic heavy metal sensor n=1 Tax=Novacetimonas pomaceti TaxID=2021998 RepID=A0ABX5P6H7_9PROT|nr:periplasmic heavy metal sensor [Novacetimonas pomaceti]MBV1832857.1 periplasmic heavy metal sensor [Novacetimonas pomaceti]PYD47666.1 hypothetical protein C3920_08560 [Novacetimonas pomaceti]